MIHHISIHALLAESDEPATGWHNKDNVFLSTLSLRRATQAQTFKITSLRISIHALLAESDSPASVTPAPSRNFYPRSPCGERRPMDVPQYQILDISIHALLAESDLDGSKSSIAEVSFLSTLSLRRATGSQPPYAHPTRDFYPRSPCGERRVTVLGIQHRIGISIHALLAESDLLRNS